MLDRDLIHVLLDRATPRGRRRLLMVAAWPRACAAGGRGELRLKRWAMLASVPLTEARILGPPLLELGICTEGGGIDDTAAAVVGAVIVDELEPKARTRKRADPDNPKG